MFRRRCFLKERCSATEVKTKDGNVIGKKNSPTENNNYFLKIHVLKVSGNEYVISLDW